MVGDDGQEPSGVSIEHTLELGSVAGESGKKRDAPNSEDEGHVIAELDRPEPHAPCLALVAGSRVPMATSALTIAPNASASVGGSASRWLAARPAVARSAADSGRPQSRSKAAQAVRRSAAHRGHSSTISTSARANSASPTSAVADVPGPGGLAQMMASASWPLSARRHSASTSGAAASAARGSCESEIVQLERRGVGSDLVAVDGVGQRARRGQQCRHALRSRRGTRRAPPIGPAGVRVRGWGRRTAPRRRVPSTHRPRRRGARPASGARPSAARARRSWSPRPISLASAARMSLRSSSTRSSRSTISGT